jgi:chemotaxis response regulator CheB
MMVEPDNVYVMPSNNILTLQNRRLVLRANTSPREPKPIDIFLGSLALDAGERAIGIVLSGGNSDGTLGVKAIITSPKGTFDLFCGCQNWLLAVCSDRPEEGICCSQL